MKSSDLESRVEHLEKLNRWHMNAMNILILMNEKHRATKDNPDVTSIFEDTVSFINQVQEFEHIFFFMVDENDSHWTLLPSSQH